MELKIIEIHKSETLDDIVVQNLTEKPFLEGKFSKYKGGNGVVDGIWVLVESEDFCDTHGRDEYNDTYPLYIR